MRSLEQREAPLWGAILLVVVMQLFSKVKAVHTSLCWRDIKPDVVTHQLGDVFSPYPKLAFFHRGHAYHVAVDP